MRKRLIQANIQRYKRLPNVSLSNDNKQLLHEVFILYAELYQCRGKKCVTKTESSNCFIVHQFQVKKINMVTQEHIYLE